MNKKFFHGQYKVNSYFEGTGPPLPGCRRGGAKILEPLRDKVPPEVFTTRLSTRLPARRRTCAPTARRTRLLREAGYEVRDGKQVGSCAPARR
jgi:microcin C transport system substrate-binding protein